MRAGPRDSRRYGSASSCAALRFSGSMFSRPRNTRLTPAAPAFSMKRGTLWQAVSTWITKRESSALLAQRNQPVEDRFPVAVARQIVVGDEEVADAVGVIGAHKALDVVGGAIARLAALHVDDGAERAEEWAAASGVEARDDADRASDPVARQERIGRALERGQIIEVIVDRLQGSGRGVAQHLVEPALRLAGEQRNAEVERLVERIRPLRQHREATRDMEAADADLDARRPQGTGEVQHMRELVRLDADKAYKSEAARLLDLPGDAVRADARIGLVDRENLDVDVFAERLGLHRLLRDAEEARERIGRQRRFHPLDDVAVVVVMRRLDQKQQKSAPLRDFGHGSRLPGQNARSRMPSSSLVALSDNSLCRATQSPLRGH